MALIRIRLHAAPVRLTVTPGDAGTPRAVLRPTATPVRIRLDPIKGEKGDPGAAGLTAFEHSQASASAEWIINHNLGRRPAITLFTMGGQQMMADITHISTNQARVYFAAATSGSARAI